MAAQRAQSRLIREGAYTFACTFDTGKVHGPDDLIPRLRRIDGFSPWGKCGFEGMNHAMIDVRVYA
jgi:hypothetical protein